MSNASKDIPVTCFRRGFTSLYLRRVTPLRLALLIFKPLCKIKQYNLNTQLLTELNPLLNLFVVDQVPNRVHVVGSFVFVFPVTLSY